MTSAGLRPQADIARSNTPTRTDALPGPRVSERFFDAAHDALRSVGLVPGIRIATPRRAVRHPGFATPAHRRVPFGWLYGVHSDYLDFVQLLSDDQHLAVILDERRDQ
jgi:hypothetical protein